ncbi:hypothetical protein C0992_005705 [Termitomyces sp. T32_za158]|nr:hypothetical protein C0992_005705 [Termitomyces sp. T32_za158]
MHANPTGLAAIGTVGLTVYNKFIIHVEGSLFSYSLDVIAQAALERIQSLEAITDTMEKVTKFDSAIIFFKHRDIEGQQLTGICSEKGIIVVDPKNLKSKSVVVPDLSEASWIPAINELKAQLEGCRPLGLVSLPKDHEILVVFDREIVCCFVTRKGKPSSGKFIKWERKAASFASRNDHVFLFSPQFIEIRNVTSGVILQVIEGANIRLLHMGRLNEKPLVAMKGNKEDQDGTSEKIVELEETTELSIATPVSASPNAWDEWDM